ncbi:MAG: MlaD family protein [Candidatus Sulfotelmatobacter sp.]|jgi:phospholipid/cholesterol/gamma-HCH transport system substrate-binding protein
MTRAVRLGAFIVVTLGILASGIFIIGSKQYLFRSTYQLKSQFTDVVGLDAGGDVRVGGVHVGTVRNILLPDKPGGKVTVVMDIDNKTHEIIKKDSVASIETEGLLGNQYMAISFGTASGSDVRDGDYLTSHPPLEMADLLAKTSGILDSSQQAIQNATQATANLSSISAKIDRGQGTVGALVNDRALYNNLEQTTGKLNDTMVQAQAGVTDFQENMEALKHNFFVRGYFKSRGYEDSAELKQNAITSLPQATPIKEFTYPAKQLFAKQDSAKLKNQKSLKDGGQYLADNEYGLAVIAVSAGMEGDAQKDQTLTEARAMVVREYLVENFGFDDTQVKTLGMGKQADDKGEGGWGTVRIVIYPAGTEIPANKAGADATAKPNAQQALPVSTGGASTPQQ